MVVAKLFGALAISLICFAFLGGKAMHTPTYLYIHATYFVASPGFFIELEAIIALGFALAYFAAGLVKHPLSNSLGLVHFGLITIGFVLVGLSLYQVGSANVSLSPPFPIYVASARMEGDPSSIVRVFYLLFAGVVSFFLGCIAFIINIVWMAVQSWRTQVPIS